LSIIGVLRLCDCVADSYIKGRFPFVHSLIYRILQKHNCVCDVVIAGEPLQEYIWPVLRYAVLCWAV